LWWWKDYYDLQVREVLRCLINDRAASITGAAGMARVTAGSGRAAIYVTNFANLRGASTR
jgi:hypothetical protein